MDVALVLSLVLSSVIGFSLGLFGGGGSILAVPVLVYVTRVAPAAAVGMSLAIVGTTSLTATFSHYRQGHVRLGVAALFGGAGVPAAFLAAGTTHLVSGRVLMIAFAALMVVVGSWMFASSRKAESTEHGESRPRTVYALVAGAAVGGITGFLGVGGGFLVVPALVAFTGLRMREAIGTSLLVIAINSGAGFLGHVTGDHLDLGLAAAMTVFAVLGALVGERVARAASPERLRRGFAWFVIAIGVAVAVSAGVGVRTG
jgi:hypothetical protein